MDKVADTSKQVVVLGMHRSGTSMLSKILSNIGFDMGKSHEVRDISNVDGHYEDVEILEINEEILTLLNSTWAEPPSSRCVRTNESLIANKYAKYIRERKRDGGE